MLSLKSPGVSITSRLPWKFIAAAILPPVSNAMARVDEGELATLLPIRFAHKYAPSVAAYRAIHASMPSVDGLDLTVPEVDVVGDVTADDDITVARRGDG